MDGERIPAIATIDSAQLEQELIERAMHIVRMHERDNSLGNRPLPVIQA